MSNVLPFPSGMPPSDGGGPEDPMLEKRVEGLEKDVRDIRSTLQRFEILLLEIRTSLPNCATKDDISNLHTETTAIRTAMVTRSDLEDLRKDAIRHREDTAEIKGQIKNIPSTWQMITFMLGSQIAFAGILFTAFKFGLK